MERYFKPFCIAPHPDVIGAWREEYEARMKELGDMPMVRIAEKPKPYGLDDEVIYPKAEIRGWVLTAPRPPIVSKVSGVVRIVVLLVDFEDNEASTDPEHYYDFLFSDGTYPTGSLRDYYTEVSHGKVLLYGDVFGWYRAPNPYSYYTNKQYGLGKYPNNVQRMVEDTVALASSEVDFSLYDSNRDNYVDALIVVHAGPGAEVFPPSGALNNIWSHKWVTSHTLDYNEVNMFAYLTVPEDGKLGVFAHELGHLLFRWPDLYDYVYPKSSGLGEWCVMASGSWNNGGDTPAHPSAWCKLQQGWVDPITIEDSISSWRIVRSTASIPLFREKGF
jgi:immune inhibitor A